MATQVTFTRTGETEIYYSITGAYSSTAYSYVVQVMSNSSYAWHDKAYATVSSSGTARGYISVNDNSAYYCRVDILYNDSHSSYIPYTAGTRVAAYVEETESYSGYISGYSIDGYYGTEDVPYYGRVDIKVVLSEGAGTGWYIQVNNSSVNRTYISMSGTYTIGLDNLYDGGGTTYTIKLIDPDGVQQDSRYIYSRETPTVTHTLFYLANDGSGAPSSQTVTVAAWDDPHYFTISYTEPVRDGYTFLGWSKSSSATSATYTGGNTIGVSGQVTLYAVWKQSPYTYYLVFDANGGSGAPSTKSVSSYDTYYTFYLSNYSLSTPTRSGYNFVGWGTSYSSTVAATSFTAYQSSGCSVTAYAIWEKVAAAVAPNITNLTISDVSSSGFRVSATQDNLTSGYWRIEISTSNSFSSIASYSNSVGYLQSTLSYTFSGLSANTRYYIRIQNEYNGSYEYTMGWSRYTGIVPFAWTGSDSTTVVTGQPVKDAITAEKWNLLQAKISQVSVRNGGGSVSLGDVAQGATMTAAAFNAVRNAMAALSSAGSVPGTRNKGDQILASYFANGTSSLKSAINRAIEALND